MMFNLPTHICVTRPQWVKYQILTRNIHNDDVIMSVIASQITSLAIVYSTVYSDADQRKHQNSASLAFVRGIHRSPVNSPHKWPVTRKMFPFDDVIMPFCSAVQNAESCVARIPAECLQTAISNRIHNIGVCTLEYSGESSKWRHMGDVTFVQARIQSSALLALCKGKRDQKGGKRFYIIIKIPHPLLLHHTCCSMDAVRR